MTDDLFADPAPDEELSAPIRCPHCGELHSQCRPAAVEILRETVRRDNRDRLAWTEGALSVMHEGDRVAVARWLQGALDRPPLSNRGVRTIEPIRAVLDALWRDIYEITPDPLSPVVEYEGEAWRVWTPHHELVEMREDAL